MTEKEAKTKWCHRRPRIGSPDTRALSPGHCCIGSACMAWRWLGTHVNDPENPKGDLIWSTDIYGFCGIAGHPHAGPGRT